MKRIPDKFIDLILCDLPYGTTQNKWDAVIPFEPMWEQYKRIAKDNAAFVFTAAQPFTTALIVSNPSDFRYTLVWDKVGTTGFQTAKVMPLRRHEDICVFYRKKPTYNPAMETRGEPRKKGGSKTDNGCYGELRSVESFNNTYYPTSIVTVSNASKKGLVHPTQKPVELMEFLVKQYSNEGDKVLDNCMGSGTTGVACANTGRHFIGIEMDEQYFSIASERIKAAQQISTNQ
jgi:site-specific DNA-methyltransferase (adenine-specific)